MIKLHAKLAIEPHCKGGWELVLWTGDAFDRSTPFRKMLADIADVLNREAPTSIRLPRYHASEDGIEGMLQFGDEPIRIYYEHALSYLALMSNNGSALHKIAECLQPVVALA
jgi:hypothetical protein